MQNLFSLRVKLNDGATLLVKATESDHRTFPDTHTRVDVAAILVKDGNRQVIWTRGTNYIGIPAHQTIDGTYAKAAALRHLAMKPGDTDADYFEGWTDTQLEFADTYGDEIRMIAEWRYGEAS